MLRLIELFVYWYPAIMSVVWVVGAIIFHIANEKKKDSLELTQTPMVSILVPCFNEAGTIENTVKQLSILNYPHYEIIAINDGSRDETSEVIASLLPRYEKLRFIDLKENKGKANALYLGLMAAKGEILLGVDSDSYILPDALNYMVPHFTNPHNGERVGAVTGNPRVRNRSSLLAKIQLCEYASIISLIKRTQRVWGKIMTVSGVVVAFRKRALMDSNLWDRDMITEDIGVTWKLEKNFWDVRYEPKALCMMLVPETVKGLYKQRRRWTNGGMEILRRHFNIFESWKTRRMVPVYLEQILTILWAACWLFLTILLFLSIFASKELIILPYIWKCLFLSLVCIVQFFVAMVLDSKYDRDLLKHAVVAIWYPFLYWYVNAIIVLTSLPNLFRRRKKTATWSSPDRGIGTEQHKKNRTRRDFTVKVIPYGVVEKEDPLKGLFEEEPPVGEVTEGEKQQRPVLINNGKVENASESLPEGQPAAEGFHMDRAYDIREHLITGKQVWWKKILEWVLTILGWGVMLSFVGYLGYGYLALHYGWFLPDLFVYNREMLSVLKEYFFVLFISVLVVTVVLIVWKNYNRIRFGRKNRRKFRAAVTNEELAERFEVDLGVIEILQREKHVELNSNIVPEELGMGGRDNRNRDSQRKN